MNKDVKTAVRKHKATELHKSAVQTHERSKEKAIIKVIEISASDTVKTFGSRAATLYWLLQHHQSMHLAEPLIELTHDLGAYAENPLRGAKQQYDSHRFVNEMQHLIANVVRKEVTDRLSLVQVRFTVFHIYYYSRNSVFQQMK